MENTTEIGNQIERLTRASDKDQRLVQVVSLSDGSDRLYATKTDNTGARTLGSELTPPQPAKLQVSTLTGFVDACKNAIAKPDGKFVHVEDYLTVSVKEAVCDFYGVRDTLLVAKHVPLGAFTYNEYYTDPAKFIIALQVSFLATENLLWLVKVASALKAGNSVQVEDNGFAQIVTVKQGEVGSADVTIPPRLKLVPLTTFDEAAQVEREFLIRFKQGPGGAPAIAIFAVDGTKWQGECMRAIADYLRKHLPENSVILA
jgi:hypothetical protein